MFYLTASISHLYIDIVFQDSNQSLAEMISMLLPTNYGSSSFLNTVINAWKLGRSKVRELLAMWIDFYVNNFLVVFSVILHIDYVILRNWVNFDFLLCHAVRGFCYLGRQNNWLDQLRSVKFGVNQNWWRQSYRKIEDHHGMKQYLFYNYR